VRVLKVWISNIVYTLIAIVTFVIAVYILRGVIRFRLRKLRGYQKLANIFYSIAFLVLCLGLLHIWGILSLLISFAAALGIIGVMFGFAIIHVWLSNAIAGVSLLFDKLIVVGSRIEIDGIKGRITQITLTSTKMATDDGKLMIIPNVSFRDRPYLIIKAPKIKKLEARR
jgi:small-conductance mechanosensitive channel